MIPVLPMIQTRRLTLQILEATDAEVILDNRTNDERIASFMTYLANSTSFESDMVSLVLSVRKKSTGVTLGAVSFACLTESHGVIDCMMLKPPRATGTVVETVKGFVAWAFATLPKLATISWGCVAGDPLGGKVPEACGMVITDQYLILPSGSGKVPRKVVEWSIGRPEENERG
jgi:hypothetical protein